jgi:hypothetical protein
MSLTPTQLQELQTIVLDLGEEFPHNSDALWNASIRIQKAGLGPVTGAGQAAFDAAVADIKQCQDDVQPYQQRQGSPNSGFDVAVLQALPIGAQFPVGNVGDIMYLETAPNTYVAVDQITIDPVGPNSVQMDEVGTTVFRTVPPASGGIEINNLSTGAGFERVLTTADLGGGAVPGGVDTNVQFNDAGAFGGDDRFLWTGTVMSVLSPALTGSIELDWRTEFNPRLTFAKSGGAAEIVTPGQLNIHAAAGNTVRIVSGPLITAPSLVLVHNALRAQIFTGIGAGEIEMFAANGAEDVRFRFDTGIKIEEKAAAHASVLTFGQFWVRDTLDGEPMFTDDQGVDTVLNAAGSPGGADTNIQFNNSGAFGGSASFTWDDTTKQLVIDPAGGTLAAINFPNVRTSQTLIAMGGVGSSTIEWEIFRSTDNSGTTFWALTDSHSLSTANHRLFFENQAGFKFIEMDNSGELRLMGTESTEMMFLDAAADGVSIRNDATLYLEQTAANANITGHGQLRVEASDDTLHYITEAGVDFVLNAAPAVTQLEDGSGNPATVAEGLGITAIRSVGNIDGEGREVEWQNQNGTTRASLGTEFFTDFIMRNHIVGGSLIMRVGTGGGSRIRGHFSGDAAAGGFSAYAGTSAVPRLQTLNHGVEVGNGTLFLVEQAAQEADIASQGQLWVNSADDSLNYVTEAGVVFDLTAGLTQPITLTAPIDGDGFDLNDMGVLFIREQAAQEADVSGQMQFWVRDDAFDQSLRVVTGSGIVIPLAAINESDINTSNISVPGTGFTEVLVSQPKENQRYVYQCSFQYSAPATDDLRVELVIDTLATFSGTISWVGGGSTPGSAGLHSAIGEVITNIVDIDTDGSVSPDGVYVTIIGVLINGNQATTTMSLRVAKQADVGANAIVYLAAGHSWRAIQSF